MKRITSLTAALLILWIGNLHAQPLITDTSSVWTIFYEELGNPNTYLLDYKFGETEEFIGLEYHRLYLDGFGSVGFEPTPDLLRYDGEGRYYWYKEYADQEYIHYDFTLTVGDTISLTESMAVPEVFGPIDLTVTAVDTVTYADNLPRKRITLNDSTNPDLLQIVWIEGQGTLRGPIYLPDSFAFNYESGFATCSYTTAATVLYEPDNPSFCEPSSTRNVGDFEVKVSPNPTNGNIRITTDLSPARTVIHDYSGRIIMEVPGVTEIDLGNLPAGIYTLRVWSADQQFAQRLVAKH